MLRFGSELADVVFPVDATVRGITNRIVKLASGVLALCGAADTNAIGVMRAGNGVTRVRGIVEVEASGPITAGNVAYQAANGKVAASGTVRAGVALNTSVNDGDVIELLLG